MPQSKKLVRYGEEVYQVSDYKIHKITYEIGEINTRVYVKYVNSRFSEYALTIPNNEKNRVNIALLSDVFVSIMSLNAQLVANKG